MASLPLGPQSQPPPAPPQSHPQLDNDPMKVRRPDLDSDKVSFFSSISIFVAACFEFRSTLLFVSTRILSDLLLFSFSVCDCANFKVYSAYFLFLFFVK